MTTAWPHQPPISEMCAALVGKVEIVGWRKPGLEQGMTHSTMLNKSSEVESDVLLRDDTVFFFDVYDIFIVITKTALLKTVWTSIGSEEGEEFEKYVGSGDHHKWNQFMLSSRPVRVGSASHTSKKNDQVNARETHIYRTTEEITVARVYEENESGYAGIEGTFLDGFNAEQVIHAILPEKFVQANSNLYETHQRLTELYFEERFKGTIILCSGTMTMTLLASGPRIKKYFAMERHENASHQHPGSDTESDHNGQGGATTPEAQEVEALAREMIHSLSTSGDLPLAHGLTDEQIATLKQQEWQPSHGIQPFTSPWSSLKNPPPVSDTTSIIDCLRPIPTAPASPIKKTATMFKDANRPTMTSLQGSLD
ncbi:hypothetical protein K457DRAFT_21798 [Linnemannia elongata AG-77]|uniref:Uncharacterized protein n=1 Tax=Linnemannia elongata AG-77 TaxID=1314771 RepID=A0A197JPB4_9FUNG|nr:hypothetical protein K457DRAFT_21798 [Linnemannia elongata AG-77]